MRTKERTIQLGIAVLLTIVGSTLLVCGFWVEPVGEISDSILVAYGEVMTFAGTIIGIDYNYWYKFKKFRTTLEEEAREEQAKSKS